MHYIIDHYSFFVIMSDFFFRLMGSLLLVFFCCDLFEKLMGPKQRPEGHQRDAALVNNIYLYIWVSHNTFIFILL